MSKILLKGETYSAPPAMHTIHLEQRWRYRPDHGSHRYLDASCLLYNNNGKMIEVVDYSSRRSVEGNRSPLNPSTNHLHG